MEIIPAGIEADVLGTDSQNVKNYFEFRKKRMKPSRTY